MWVFAIIALVASYIISGALAPSPTKPQPQSLGESDVPQIDEGTAQKVIFGDVWIQDWYVLWWGNQRSEAVKEKQSGGGK